MELPVPRTLRRQLSAVHGYGNRVSTRYRFFREHDSTVCIREMAHNRRVVLEKGVVPSRGIGRFRTHAVQIGIQTGSVLFRCAGIVARYLSVALLLR